MFRLFIITVRTISTMSEIKTKVDLRNIFLKSVAAVEPSTLIRKCVSVQGNRLFVKDDAYDLKKPCYLVGFGKAVFNMALTLETLLDTNLKEGIVTVPTGIIQDRTRITSRIRFIEGAKDNLPDENAMMGAKQIKELTQSLQLNDLLIVLISGGGSALLPLPKAPAVLSEKLAIVKALAAAGADIQELNCVRKKLSELKGGKLANLAHPAEVVTLILSDIIGDPVDSIASGPTVENADPPNAAWEIVKKYGIRNLSDSIKSILQDEDSISKSKPFNHVHNYIIGNNQIAAEAAVEEAKALGYQSLLLSTAVKGDVGEISKIYAELASLISSGERERLKVFLQSYLNASAAVINEIMESDFNSKFCLVLGGEPTVIVKGQGRGGRNQQLALSFSKEISKFDLKSTVWFLSCGTDGMDGPTDAAGAIGGCNLLNKALEEDLDPVDFLADNDSYGFYSKFDSGSYLIRTGHTGTNVMDIHVIIVLPRCG